jgi:hypothetical protein
MDFKELKDKKSTKKKSSSSSDSSKDLKSAIMGAISADMKEDQVGHDEYLVIRKAFLPLVDKPFTMRAQSKLPDGYILKRDISWFKVIGPSGKDHLITYVSRSHDFKIEHFDEGDAPYNRGALERLEKNNDILKNPKRLDDLINYFSEISKYYHALKKLVNDEDDRKMGNYHNPASYDILRALDVDSRILSDIKYGRR